MAMEVTVFKCGIHNFFFLRNEIVAMEIEVFKGFNDFNKKTLF